VSIVWPCELDVESYARAVREPGFEFPRPRCPECNLLTIFWSGYDRRVRTAGVVIIWVARVRCAGCARTHALLPSFLFVNRLDAVAVIGLALELRTVGRSLRFIAIEVARPESTVRDWYRRWEERVELLAKLVLALAVSHGWRGAELKTAAAPRCLEGLRRLGYQLGRRRRDHPRWRLASLITGGGWLGTNTSPLPSAQGWFWMPTKSTSEVSHGCGVKKFDSGRDHRVGDRGRAGSDCASC